MSNIQKRFFNGLILSLIIFGLVSSCGNSDNEGQGLSGGAPNNLGINLGLEGSGNYNATSVEQIRELIRQGSFVRSNFRFGNFEEYSLIKGTCSTVYNDFLWIDDIPSTQCTPSNSTIIREYTDGRVEGHHFGNTKTEIINGFISLMDSATRVYLVDNFGRITYGGQQTSRIRITTSVNGDESVYYIDLQRPLASNPASRYSESVSAGNEIEVIEYAYPL